MKTVMLALSLICGLNALQACTSVDAERSQLRGALDDARGLAAEIDAWQHRSDSAVSETATETIASFQTRANSILDTVAGTSDNATTGIDLAGVKQALSSIAEFDTSRIADASQSGRSSVIQQFGSLGESLRSAVSRVRLPS